MAKKVVKKRTKKFEATPVTAEIVAEVFKQEDPEVPKLIENSENPEAVVDFMEAVDKAMDNDEGLNKLLNQGDVILGVDLSEPTNTQLPQLRVKEAVVNIAGSTPTKDFAVSMCKFFESHPNAVLRVRYIGAGAGAQLTKSTIEANKLLSSRGQMVSRYDFWTNENGKSVNNVRLIPVDIQPSSMAQALSGNEVDYIHLDAFLKKKEDDGGDK